MKIRNTYLLIISIVGLVSLCFYSTYAMFTASVDTGTFANIKAVNAYDVKYRNLTINPGEQEIIEIEVKNITSSNLYYGVWYEMIDPTSITSNMVVAKLNVSASETVGQVSGNTSKVVTLLIENNASSTFTIDIGIVYSNASNLNLPTTRNIITEEVSLPNLDTSGANTPELMEGLLPVMYNGTTWVKADDANGYERYKWYDYNDKQWANAVLVSSATRDTYKTAAVGTTINESDILAYYVWIPRYKYKVWNISLVGGTDSYGAQTKGIDIVFENELQKTGEIQCGIYSFEMPTSSSAPPNEECSGSNGQYYTHPAFLFGGVALRGMWVGKFEVSNSTSQIKIKPNVLSLRSQTITAFFSAIRNMQSSTYGLTTDSFKASSHMIKNIEWGAVAYLTHSKYGRCTNGTCTEVGLNSYYSSGSIKTGCGPQSEGSLSSGTTCNVYNSQLGQLASTTGNVYGIYDMSGGSYEYVMGNMSSEDGSYVYNPKSAGDGLEYSDADIDKYAFGQSNYKEKAWRRTRFGDGIGEVSVAEERSWNQDYSYFVFKHSTDTTRDNPWFRRGGRYGSGEGAGIFSSDSSDGSAGSNYSTRAVLVCFTTTNNCNYN